MPGPAVHLIIQKNFAKAMKNGLEDLPDSFPDSDKDVMDKHPEAAALGSMGPDFLLFNSNDWPLGLLGRTVDKLVEFEEKFKNFYDNFSPITDKIDNILSRSSIADALDELSEDFKNLYATMLDQALDLSIIAGFEVYDPITYVGSPIQNQDPHKDWWWFDTLHYAKTGQFAKELLNSASPGTIQRAYALGYLTHVAADVTGHPFVNMMAGGPYRSHSRRHKLVENCMDADMHDKFVGGEVVFSSLHNDMTFDSPSGNIPEELSDHIRASLKNVYGSQYAPIPTHDNLRTAHSLFTTWLGNATSTGTLPPPEGYHLTEELRENWDRLTENLSDALNSSAEHAHSITSPDSIWDLLGGLLGVLLDGLAIGAAIVDFIIGSALEIGFSPIKQWIRIAYAYLYQSYYTTRQIAVLTGFKHPLLRDLDDNRLKNLLHPENTDFRENAAQDLQNEYPKKAFPDYNPDVHLIVPKDADTEQETTTSAPQSYFSQGASLFINGRLGITEGFLDRMNGFQALARDGEYEDGITADFKDEMVSDHLGNANDLCENLYRKAHTSEIPDFSLDADRGMGWITWEFDPSPDDPGNGNVDVENPANT